MPGIELGLLNALSHLILTRVLGNRNIIIPVLQRKELRGRDYDVFAKVIHQRPSDEGFYIPSQTLNFPLKVMRKCERILTRSSFYKGRPGDGTGGGKEGIWGREKQISTN